MIDPDIEMPTPVSVPTTKEEFERQVRACAQRLEHFSHALATRYHPRVIRAAMLTLSVRTTASLSMADLLKAAAIGCLGIGATIAALMMSGCASQEQYLTVTHPLQPELDAELRADVRKRIDRDSVYIEHVLWMEEYCKQPEHVRQETVREPRCERFWKARK